MRKMLRRLGSVSDFAMMLARLSGYHLRGHACGQLVECDDFVQ